MVIVYYCCGMGISLDYREFLITSKIVVRILNIANWF